MPLPFSFASKTSSLALGIDDDDGIDDPPDSLSLFSAQSSSPVIDPTLSPSLLSASTSSPIHFSTPKAEIPGTQSLLDRLIALRNVHDDDLPLFGHLNNDRLGARAQPPTVCPLRRQHVADDDNDRLERPIPILLPRENDELKSENVALQLQHEDDQREIARLRQQHEDDRREITLLRNLQEQRQQQPITAPRLPPSPPQQQQPNPPPPPTAMRLREQLQTLPPSDVLQPFISKSKRKKKKKRQQIEAVTAAAANMTRPPGSDSVTLPPPTPRPNLRPAQQQQPVQRQQQPQTQQQHRQSQPQTIYFYHDSNSDDKFLTTNDIQYTLDLINKKQNRPTNKYNIHKHATYELRQTYNKITHTTYNKNDIVILNILTNDARTTKKRPPKTLFQTKTLLSAIYDHLLSQLSPNNIILLESPPLLYEDIFPHAALSLQAAWEKGVRFAPTLIGETHVRRYDGVHIEKGYHHLLAKAVACAILRQNPHPLFGLGRPPQGIFGPWLSPRGQGMALPAYSSTAARPPPYHFRPRQMQPTRPTRPLMDIDIPRINPR